MEDDFLKNGFIIKSYDKNRRDIGKKYYGIANGMTWPLDIYEDKISRSLSNEALERWFGYQDNRLWVIPDEEYLERYIKHCYDLNMSISCLQIESKNSIITTKMDMPIRRCLGYEYVDIDMNTSCLYDDLFTTDFPTNKQIDLIRERLNAYGLLDTITEMYEYLKIRKELLSVYCEVEEYYAPTIIRLSEVWPVYKDQICGIYNSWWSV